MSTAIAKVEPLTTARALRGPYDYKVPERLGDVGVGTLLEVPFGHQRLLGVVVEMADRSSVPANRLVEPIAALDAGVPRDLVELGLWVAREYCSTPARGLELVLPPGTQTARGQTAARTETVAVATVAATAALAADASGLGPVQRRALELLTAGGAEVGAGTLAEAGVARDALLRLQRRGLVELSDREVRRRPVATAIGALSGAVELDPAQRAATERIVAALDDPTELLLHGVTGSGKTEVYLAAAEQALARGRGVIVLVPEIAMTPQALARFTARFGDGVAILHSKLSAGERRDEWHRLRSGEARICVGPRSAVFAPIDGLGLVIVDEEHDASYKQEGDPKYDAREVARRRAAEAGAALVLGTATPRPESWSSLERLELPNRVDGRAMPAVEIVDMRERDGRDRGAARANSRGACRAGRGRFGSGQGDRPGQPPWLGSAPGLPHLRLGRGVPRMRRLACRPSRRRAVPLPSLRPRGAAARIVSGVRVGDACPRRGWHAAHRGADRGGDGWAARVPPRRGQRRPASAATSRSSRRSRLPTLACSSAPRWSRRATTSPTSSSLSWSMPTRRCGFLTFVPRSERSRSSLSSPDAAAAALGPVA